MKPSEIYQHFNQDLFMDLNPPFIDIELHQFDGTKKGDLLSLTTNVLGYYQSWKNEIIDEHISEEEIYFIDQATEMPFPITSWKHTHKMRKVDEQYTYIVDDIYYECTNEFFEICMYPVIWMTMLYRKPIYLDKFIKDT